ncbi:MAG TPA: DUF1853 family protein [Noviherbaspirillum sp.]|nr:DUF1853 family protein [Noviherbaspirillum sp.]
MQVPTDHSPQTFQAQFHRRWNHLVDPHVRTLAWLLDAPDLLDPGAEQWSGRIATLGSVDDDTAAWLTSIDRAPGDLHAFIGLQPFTRLGRYAEKLMAFYLMHRDMLVAHGVQVQAGKNETIGEFDFLVRQGKDLVHWEFATKLYLLESSGHGRHAEYFVGPNLADTLGAKVRKIMERQLSLSQHPAARQQLTEQIAFAQALVKGWLFYHRQTPVTELPQGIARAHCRGFWLEQKDFGEFSGSETGRYAVLPRLSWLAPAKTSIENTLDSADLNLLLASHFEQHRTPVLIAIVEPDGKDMLEMDRGFIVPDDWRSRAESRIAHPA